jgi:hypothetical protein
MNADGTRRSLEVDPRNVAVRIVEAHEAVHVRDGTKRRSDRRLDVVPGRIRNRDLHEGPEQRPRAANVI